MDAKEAGLTFNWINPNTQQKTKEQSKKR
jgi:hypothetical protein